MAVWFTYEGRLHVAGSSASDSAVSVREWELDLTQMSRLAPRMAASAINVRVSVDVMQKMLWVLQTSDKCRLFIIFYLSLHPYIKAWIMGNTESLSSTLESDPDPRRRYTVRGISAFNLTSVYIKLQLSHLQLDVIQHITSQHFNISYLIFYAFFCNNCQFLHYQYNPPGSPDPDFRNHCFRAAEDMMQLSVTACVVPPPDKQILADRVEGVSP